MIRATVAALRRVVSMFAAGWLLTLGVAVALVLARLLVPHTAAVIGFAVAAAIALVFVGDVLLAARRASGAALITRRR